jgi:hypothetical protein
MAQQMLVGAMHEREEIMNNLNAVRDDITKYEALLKPHIPKPPTIMDIEDDSDSISDDSLDLEA